MAVPTSNIGVSDVISEMGKSGTNQHLKQCVRAAVESSTSLGGQAAQSSLNAFSGYVHGDTLNSSLCVFKFDPQLPIESGRVYDPYDDTVSSLPEVNSDSNVYSTSISQATYVQGTGTGAGRAGYIDISQVNSSSHAGIEWVNVSTGSSYKPNGSHFYIGMWLRIDSAPSGQVRLINNDGAATTSTPYTGFTVSLNSNLTIAALVGNGGGTASFNRRTYITSALSLNTWYFMEFFWSQVNTSVPVCVIYATPSSSTNRVTTSIVASTSGTGGAMAYSSTRKLYIGNSGANVANSLDAKIGHVWIMDGIVETTAAVLENMFDATKTQYT
jgi:hypothetical protein